MNPGMVDENPPRMKACPLTFGGCVCVGGGEGKERGDRVQKTTSGTKMRKQEQG